MVEEIKTRTRRTHFQALAHKRYPRMRWLEGDGEWIAMTQCPALNDERQHWAYRLFAMQHMAEEWLSTINTLGCDVMLDGKQQCYGKERHRVWKLS